LPASREFGFVDGFSFGPLDGQKCHYVFKTPLLCIKIWNTLTKNRNSNLTENAQIFQIGLIPQRYGVQAEKAYYGAKATSHPLSSKS
jgi:hypothetical protein